MAGEAKLDAMLLAQRRLAGASREFAAKYDGVSAARANPRGGWSALIPGLLEAQENLEDKLTEANAAVEAYAELAE